MYQIYLQNYYEYVVLCCPPSPFVCSCCCVTSTIGSMHISPARPVIKLKVSFINHAHPLLSLPLIRLLFSPPATAWRFCKSQTVAGKWGSFAHVYTCETTAKLQAITRHRLSTLASVPPLSQYSRQEIQFPREKSQTAVDCKIRAVCNMHWICTAIHSWARNGWNLPTFDITYVILIKNKEHYHWQFIFQ